MIKGKKVSLRLFRETDIDLVCRYTSDIGEIGEFWPMHLYSEVTVKSRFAENGFWDRHEGGWMAITTSDDVLIGQINLFKGIPYTDGFEIGARIYRPEDRGKGYMTEAVRLFIDYIFELQPIHRLQICYNVKNQASKIVAEKCGFTIEGVMRGAVFHKGEYADLCVTSLLRNEWELKRHQQ